MKRPKLNPPPRKNPGGRPKGSKDKQPRQPKSTPKRSREATEKNRQEVIDGLKKLGMTGQFRAGSRMPLPMLHEIANMFRDWGDEELMLVTGENDPKKLRAARELAGNWYQRAGYWAEKLAMYLNPKPATIVAKPVLKPATDGEMEIAYEPLPKETPAESQVRNVVHVPLPAQDAVEWEKDCERYRKDQEKLAKQNAERHGKLN